MNILFFQVDENDRLPKTICKHCSQNIASWYNYDSAIKNSSEFWTKNLSGRSRDDTNANLASVSESTSHPPIISKSQKNEEMVEEFEKK